MIRPLLGLVCGVVLLRVLAVALAVPTPPYPPAADLPGSTAIPATSSAIHGWATGVVELIRGPQQMGDDLLGAVTSGDPEDALGRADATSDSPFSVVSLGDGGSITLRFSPAITNGPGFDFAVFENGITDGFLELAYVEVSSDGTHFFRFPSVSLTQTQTQINGDDSNGVFGALDPANLYNLAGKYRVGFGTPFELAELDGVSPDLDVTNVQFVRVEDVVGSLQPGFARRDSQGHVINDPWATPYSTGGFDLDAIGALHQIPEPTAAVLLLAGAPLFCRRQRSS
jgi:hypothetical protein